LTTFAVPTDELLAYPEKFYPDFIKTGEAKREAQRRL
jgi:hypothetical protein